MDDVLVIGGGPAGLFSAWLAQQRGASRGLRVRVLAAGIGSTHIMPGWFGLAATKGSPTAAARMLAEQNIKHPYNLAGLDALRGGLAALQGVCEAHGLRLVGGLDRNMALPTALGATLPAAYAPESFAAGDLNLPGAMLIAGPAGWRDFYPALCAANLGRQGFAAEPFAFDLPEIRAVKFDNLSTGLARLFDRADVRERVGQQIKARLNGATRVGLPAVLGLADYPRAWQHLRDLIGVSVYEIPTLPPSVPGIRLHNALKSALERSGVQVLLNMPVERGLVEGNRVTGVAVKSVVRETIYQAKNVILATGGLYGGGIVSDHHGGLRETVFGLAVAGARPMAEWFAEAFLSSEHPIRYAGIAADREMRPLDDQGRVMYDNVRVAGRALAGYNDACEGSTEGVWIATAFAAVQSLLG